MHKTLIPLSIFALALAIGLNAIPSAQATGSQTAMCFPMADILEVTGTDKVQFAAASTVFLRKQISEEGRTNFKVLENSAGAEIICAW